MTAESLEKLAGRLGYAFNRPELLTTALTHRSMGQRNNERLEFLGDAVLNLVIAAELFQQFPQASEGQLSRLRAHLVNGKMLAQLAQELALGDYLRLGPGELKSGGFRRESILAGALEAIIGAVYLDGLFDAAQQLILRIYAASLASVSPDIDTKDPKTRLQEYLQANKLPLPGYSVEAVSGDEHDQQFTVHCTVSGLAKPVVGHGRSRRRAEQAAAAEALARLQRGE